MTLALLIAALDMLSVETGSLACLGCEFENGCSVHGCAVIKDAARLLRERKGETKDEADEKNVCV